MLLCVLNTAAVEDCVWGEAAWRGRGGVVAGLLVDFSTIDPDATREFAARLRTRNRSGWVDAPVSGGPAGGEAGALTVMAGAARPDMRFAAPVLTDLGRTSRTWAGRRWSGYEMLNQAMVGAGFVLMAEALVLRRRRGSTPPPCPPASPAALPIARF